MRRNEAEQKKRKLKQNKKKYGKSKEHFLHCLFMFNPRRTTESNDEILAFSNGETNWNH